MRYTWVMHILFITESIEPRSGWGTYSLNTIEEMSRRHHKITLLTHARAPLPGLPGALKMLSSPFAILRAAWTISLTIRADRPDIIHFLVEPYALAMPLVGWMCKTPPWVMNLHGTYSVLPFLQWKTRWLAAHAWRQCGGFLICSQFTRSRALAAAQKTDLKAAERIENVGRMFRLGIAQNNVMVRNVILSTVEGRTNHTILFVGGVKPRNGVQEILDACVQYREQTHTPFHLHIVGTFDPEEPYVQKLFAFVETYGLAAEVTFHGKLSAEKLDALWRQTDLFMMLSRDADAHFEGFGLVFLEAAARGVPVIGSLHSGCAEAIEEGKSGYAVEATNPAAVAARMRNVLMEKQIRSEDCRTWAAKHSLAEQGEAQEECYRAAISRES